MNLLVNDGKVVGVEAGNITQYFGNITPNPQKLLIDNNVAQRLSDLDDPLHASHLTVKNGKIVVPKTIPKSDSITV